MRMINETALSEAIRDYFIKKIDKDEYKVDTVDCHADIQAILRSQPTAYNPDKVVDELYEKAFTAYDTIAVSIDDAIEIVKSGGKV